MIWAYSYRPDIWPALTTFALVIYLGVYSWRRRRIPAARVFTLACLLGSLWTLGVILELSAVDFSTKVFWAKFQAVWHLPVATTVTCFVMQYAGLEKFLIRRNYIFLFSLPVLCVMLMVTNDFHYLIWTGFKMKGDVTALPGKLFWIFISYGILIGLLNFSILVWLAIRSPGHRWPVAIMLMGQMIGRVGYTLDKLDNSLVGPGESVFLVVGVVSVAYAVALLCFHAIDPAAAARKIALQQMREGLLVVDLERHIVDVNPMAATILEIPEHNLRGRVITDVIPVAPEFLAHLGKGQRDPTEIALGKGKAVRYYNLNLTNLRGRYEELIGQLLLLHDVTEQKRAHARILDQQKVVATLQERERLARELHDGIGQVLGYVSMQVQTAIKWVRDGNNEKAESLMGRIAEVSKDAHTDVRESILKLRTGSDQNWSLIPALEKYIDRFQANYGIQTELLTSEGVEDNTFDPATEVQLFRVIQEAMTNCLKHSGARILKVDINLNRSTSNALITISDDGHGFDAGQLEQETGGHFGLVFMRERMEQICGSLKVDSNPGRGTIVKLNVPVWKQQEDYK